MSIAAWILVIVSTVNVILGLFVLLRNPRALRSISFFGVSAFITLWSICNFVTENAPVLSLNALFNKLAYFFSFLSVAAMMVFSYSFLPSNRLSKPNQKFYAIFIAIWSLFSLTSYAAGTVGREDGELVFGIGRLVLLFAGGMLFLLILAIRNLFIASRTADRKTKDQIKLIAFGSLASAIFGLVTNVVIPIFVKNFETAKFGPLVTFFLVTSTSYAIIRHGLFDIRKVVARSVAYLSMILSVAFIFLFATIFIIRFFFHEGADIFDSQQLVNTASLVVLVFLFQPIKRFFDKFTNRVFFRDVYDPQAFLDELNNTLVTTIELRDLLQKAAEVVRKNFATEYCYVNLCEKPNSAKQHVIAGNFDATSEELSKLETVMNTTNLRVMDTDGLTGADIKTAKVLAKLHAKAVVRLAGSDGVTGCILLGEKRSGSLYSKADLRMGEIVADQLGLAIQNAMKFRAIEKFNVTLQQKVDNATKELRDTNEKLLALDQAKDEFISMASHQLRTPLTSVKGYISMMLEGDAGKVSPTQKKFLEQAFTSSQRMVYLISDLLNVSRLKTGKFIIEPVDTFLPDVIDSEIDQLKSAADAKGVKLSFNKPAKFPHVMLDETKIRQVIMNFTDNAIYYTPAGGHITVNLKAGAQSIEFSVVDDGIGVPRAEQHNLFSKFFRASNAQKARPDGTGLGLFMARKVVVSSGGAVIFHSEEGKGSTFGFTFPLHKIAVKAESSAAVPVATSAEAPKTA